MKKRLLNESLGDDLSTGVVNAAVQVDSFCKPAHQTSERNNSDKDLLGSQNQSHSDSIAVDEETFTQNHMGKGSFRKLDQQGVIVPNLNEDSISEWRKQDVDEEAVFLMNTVAEPINSIADSENDETSDDLHSDISTPVIHNRTEQGELRANTPPAAVEWMEEAIEDHISSSNSGEHVDLLQSEIDESIKPMELRSHLQSQSHHKTKAIDEISKAVEKIKFSKKGLYISNIQKIDKDNHAVLQIIDTGGQPEFHEMLPALITGPAVNLLVFKLTEDLQGRYPITYHSSDGNSEPYLTSITHEEVIFHSLSSIACLRYNTVGWKFDHDEVPLKDDSEPAAYLIATHRDCVDDDKVDTVNDHLKYRIQSSVELFTENLIQFAAPDKPIFLLILPKTKKRSRTYESYFTMSLTQSSRISRFQCHGVH